ncbi:1-aminocyclopropane-1-carboxylate deaminase/D-cysteine desulfhydrase [Mangrovimicrobium sediminis]|uniref:1-aminocyclopropane-1-carboxylate deaminase/D-cysteine desulfhydrase n=1 Tax=Mangrovimicrobium sediminis TaxID=2562682 RepID=UPI001436CB91|nr:pyridoxal-phosphate dependent enzyme [Haliea sp. SAOS-164]
MPDSLPPALIQALPDVPVLGQSLAGVSVLRLDRLGGAAPGNKAFKLRYILARAQAQGLRRVLSFGGAWSNHLHALAAVGAELGLETIGVVRGGETPTAMLDDAQGWGMQLLPVSREDYRRRHDVAYQRELAQMHGPCLVIPEGGASAEGVLGCREIAALPGVDDPRWRRVVVAVGTGTTLAGLAAGLSRVGEVVGVAAIRGGDDLAPRVREALAAIAAQAGVPWHIEHGFHCGGFARADAQLRAFIPAFEHATGVPLEPVYTGKLLLAIHAQLAAGHWSPGDEILAIHSGGLQGRRGYAWLDPWP